MITKTIKGDLVKMAQKGDFDIIMHGCNCFCDMGAGIAKQIKKTFPGAYAADLETKSGDKFKLGSYTYVAVNNVTIVNAYTQYNYGRGLHCDYDAVKRVFHIINLLIQKYKSIHPDNNVRIGIPKIGAGLAGGDWEKIKQIIDEETPDIDITLVEYEKAG